MHRIFWLSLLLTGILPLPLAAETIPVAPGVAVQVSLPGDGWKISREAPLFLVEETGEHLEHELLAQGKKLDSAAITKAVQKRLAANEAYIFKPATKACLVIDFSPLREGEAEPGSKTVATSARLAGESLEGEEGASDVRQKSRKSSVSGADSAYRIDADYRQHGEPRRFIGIVGFRAPYWFYLYYTDPLGNPADQPEMEQILRTLVLVGTNGG